MVNITMWHAYVELNSGTTPVLVHDGSPTDAFPQVFLGNIVIIGKIERVLVAKERRMYKIINAPQSPGHLNYGLVPSASLCPADKLKLLPLVSEASDFRLQLYKPCAQQAYFQALRVYSAMPFAAYQLTCADEDRALRNFEDFVCAMSDVQFDALVRSMVVMGSVRGMQEMLVRPLPHAGNVTISSNKSEGELRIQAAALVQVATKTCALPDESLASGHYGYMIAQAALLWLTVVTPALPAALQPLASEFCPPEFVEAMRRRRPSMEMSGLKNELIMDTFNIFLGPWTPEPPATVLRESTDYMAEAEQRAIDVSLMVSPSDTKLCEVCNQRCHKTRRCPVCKTGEFCSQQCFKSAWKLHKASDAHKRAV